MKRDWRVLLCLFTLAGGLFFSREMVGLVFEDLLEIQPREIHDRYSYLSVSGYDDGMLAKFYGLMFNCSQSHPYFVELLAAALLLVTFLLLIWIWLKPLSHDPSY